jgi:cytoskeletal protein CcmA (bactofilin family)
MWRIKKSEDGMSSSAMRENEPPAGSKDLRSVADPVAAQLNGGARIGRTLSLKGELRGNEELVVEGEFEGTIDLGGGRLTVGSSGRVQADIHAGEIVVEGTVRGRLRATDRLQIRKSGNVTGELITARIVIEDGAYFKGSIDIQKADEAQLPRKEPATAEGFRMRPTPILLEAKERME